MPIRPFVPPCAALSLFVSFLVPAAPAHAEVYTLDPVTVTATRFERPLATTPASVTVLEAADLAPWAASPVEDILAVRGGVTVARTGGPGQQASVFMRGTDSDSVLVLVDGVKINGALFGGANLQNLRGADIARIEIVRGPRSTLYGSEAIGGVISITTRRASATAGTATAVDTASLRGERGSDNAADVRAFASHDIGDDHVALGIGDFRTDGDPATDRTSIDARHNNTSGTLGASTRRGDTRFGFDGWAGRGSTRYAECVYDAFFNCSSIAAKDQAFHNDVASLWSETAFGTGTTLRARLGHASDELDQLDATDFARTERITGSLSLERRSGQAGTGANTLVAGIDAEREDADAVVYGSPLASVNKDQAAFVRDDWTRGRHQLALGLRATEYDSFGGHATGEASYGLAIGDRGYLWAAAGRGFRAPDVTERFGFGGNPALVPESSGSVELGLRWRAGSHVFTATRFRQDIHDLIDYPAPAYTASNIAKARIDGTELGWGWHTQATQVDVQATLQDPVNADTGEQLSRRPKQQLSATARRRIGAVEWRAGLLAMDSRDNSQYDNLRLPGFAVLDLGAAWTVKPGLVLDARVANAGDTRYALARGDEGNFLMPDRAFFLGFEWRAEKAWSPR